MTTVYVVCGFTRGVMTPREHGLTAVYGSLEGAQAALGHIELIESRQYQPEAWDDREWVSSDDVWLVRECNVIEVMAEQATQLMGFSIRPHSRDKREGRKNG